mmetsp:Transcript_19033/g.49109  ORF Transcript_19033/g.49109 Transcript_19033/m.49109 type:complete len:250 (+) Transcript_19033:79-828(+)
MAPRDVVGSVPRSRRLLAKLVGGGRQHRAASAAVRNAYWRAPLRDASRTSGIIKRKPAQKAHMPTPALNSPSSRSAASDATDRTASEGTRSDTSRSPRAKPPTVRMPKASARKLQSAKPATTLKERDIAATQEATAAARKAPATQAMEPAAVVMVLKAAFGASKSATSQLPPGWRFDARHRRGEPSTRTAICPCGTRLRGADAVGRHLAREPACVTLARPGDGNPLRAVQPSKLMTWQHKYDGGLIPSD